MAKTLNPDLQAPVPDLAALVETIRVTPLGKVEPTQLESVIDILDHVRAQTLAGFDRLTQQSARLDERERAVAEKERAITLRTRLVQAREANLGLVVPAPCRRWLPWR